MYMYHVSSTPIKTEHSHYSREFFHAHLKSISSVSCSKNRSDPYHFRFVLHVLDFIQLELLYTLHTVYTFCIWFLLLSIIKKFFSSMLLNVTFVEWTFIVLQSSISLWEYTQLFLYSIYNLFILSPLMGAWVISTFLLSVKLIWTIIMSVYMDVCMVYIFFSWRNT